MRKRWNLSTSDLDLSILPPVRPFEGHPDVPWALTPTDLAKLRPNCEVEVKHYSYAQRVKAQRELRDAEAKATSVAEAWVFGDYSQHASLRYQAMEDAITAARKARQVAKEVGSP